MKYPPAPKRLTVLVLFSALVFSAAADDKVDRLVKSELQAHPIPGLALEIIQNGKCVKRAGYGLANLEWQTPVTPETVFEIGSMTKQFTAAAILMLAQEGKLSVDDKISRHLTNTPEAWKDITIRHLLTHTSGITNYTVLDGFELRQHMTQAQFIQKIGSYPLNFQPGEKWVYCNSGFNLLGYIIENVSGVDYWQFLRQRIFLPLGMTATTNRDSRYPVRFRASGYETDPAGRYINRDYDLTDLFSAGTILSTVDDIARWNASLDSQKLLTADSEKAMWTPLTLNNGDTHGYSKGRTHSYGFGWFLDPVRGHRCVSHGGLTSGFSASIQRFPDDGLAIIVLTNSNEEDVAIQVGADIAALYFGDKK
jgi:CubicO group peptidase (beta-lactamase class C family)